MHDHKNEPLSPLNQNATLVDLEDSPALANFFDDSFSETRSLRHDGWDGKKMARFCEVLAETGIVIDACRACRMSAQSAYALRHRNPLFAQSWEAALSMARARLADELLTRALKGSAEQILRDGAVVGERHQYDNKLALAVLRRLDRRAELGATFRAPPACDIPAPAPAVTGEWQPLLDALSEERSEDAARLLTPVKVDEVDEVDEVDNPPFEANDDDKFDHPRVWQEFGTEEWRTNYPPPPGFYGFQQDDWEGETYCRALSADELAALVAAGIAEPAERSGMSIEEDEAERDAFFAGLFAARDDHAPSS